MISVVLEIIIAGFVFCLSLLFFGVFVYLLHLKRRYQYKPSSSLTVDNLPTVSVCIPARNETHAMTECLERALANDYQKLEIIVLDDSSVDNTSMLVKSFAHAGVRFVEGSSLPSGWLGKNHALQGLLNEASGQYILFLDVDTILKPHSIRSLVEYAVSQNSTLVSVVPQREDRLRASVIFGTLRYFWMLLLGNKNLPAVSGAAWLVDRSKLLASGGFESYKNLARPEMYIAANFKLLPQSTLLLSSAPLGVSYEKKWRSQVETSIRLLTPEFGGSFSTMIAGILLSLVVFLPVITMVISLMNEWTVLGVSTSVYAICLAVVSSTYFKIVWKYNWWLGAFHWPYVVLQEAYLMVVSSYNYARHRVTWKGRPIRAESSTSFSNLGE